MVDSRGSMVCPMPWIHLPTVKITRPRVPMLTVAPARSCPPKRAGRSGSGGEGLSLAATCVDARCEVDGGRERTQGRKWLWRARRESRERREKE
jgi:hypothetical protein